MLLLSVQVTFLSFGSLPDRNAPRNGHAVVQKDQPEKNWHITGELESLLEEENVEAENEIPLPVFVFLFCRNHDISLLNHGVFDETTALTNTHCPRYLRIRKLTL